LGGALSGSYFKGPQCHYFGKGHTSHADKRNALRRKCLEEEFQAAQAHEPVTSKILRRWRRVVKLVN
jgi:hypothetical protein